MCFTSSRDFRTWLAKNHSQSEGILLRIFKKDSGEKSITYSETLDQAPPSDFLAELDKNKKAKAFFETLNKANVYSIVYRLQTAKKPETREKRMKAILGMLARGEKFHP